MIKNLKGKMIFSVLIFFLIVFMYVSGIGCFSRALFNMPCPGCGMTRAWLQLLQLNFAEAFRFHPGFWSPPILYIYFLFDGKPFKNKYINFGILGFISLFFIINFIIKIVEKFHELFPHLVG